MALLEWSAALELGEPEMDATHREYAELLNRLEHADDAGFLGHLDAFIGHTAEHFAAENRRMTETRLPPAHCHLHEHEQVLAIMRDVRGRVAAGEVFLGRVLATEMGKWFEHHAATMDKVLAAWLRIDESSRIELLASIPAQAHECSPGCAAHDEGGAEGATGPAAESGAHHDAHTETREPQPAR